MKIVTYNPQCAARRDRCYSILQCFAYAQIIGLQGTNAVVGRFQQNSSYRLENYKSHHLFVWHAADTEYSNVSTGVTVAWNKQTFKKSHFSAVYSPPCELQGRGGAVLFEHERFVNILAMSLYFLASGDYSYRKYVINQLLVWAQAVFDDMPKRTIPLLFIDANLHFASNVQTNQVVGPVFPARSSTNSALFVRFLKKNNMVLVHTFVGSAGPTFFHWTGHKTRVDYIPNLRIFL